MTLISDFSKGGVRKMLPFSQTAETSSSFNGERGRDGENAGIRQGELKDKKTVDFHSLLIPRTCINREVPTLGGGVLRAERAERLYFSTRLAGYQLIMKAFCCYLDARLVNLPDLRRVNDSTNCC